MAKNALSFELGGNTTMMGSIHYSRIIKTTTKYYYDLDAGVGYIPPLSYHHLNYQFGLSASANWNANIYKRSHAFGGIGLCYSDGAFQQGFESDDKRSLKGIFASLQIGYKYQRPQNGIFFKVYISPTFRLYQFTSAQYNFPSFFPFAGLGLGYSFGKG